MSKFLRSLLSVVAVIVTSSVNAQTETRLSTKQQAIVRISALTAKGDLPVLKTELNTSLDAGLTISQIKEVMIHLYAYAGFPRSLRGLQTFMTVLDERKAKGISDPGGVEATPIRAEGSRYERGKAILEQLTMVKESGTKTGYAAFAPQIEIFLKEHLFADIFERDVLTYAERELVTLSVLSTIGGVEPMLRSHLSISMNVGLSPAQLKDFVSIISTTVGEKEGNSAVAVLNELVKN